MLKRALFYLSSISLLLVVILIAAFFLFLQNSLPSLDGEKRLSQLSAPVTVDIDEHGIPIIQAKNRLDAVRSLGYLNAQDRLFQMDLMRRKNAGRLAEIFGSLALTSDMDARNYGFHRVAKVVVSQLPEQHKQYLQAYTDGINDFIQSQVLPFEFSVLGYQPDAWRMEDSVLVALGMFDMLTSWTEQEERMLTVMKKTLPAEVVAFLTPSTDTFTQQLLTNNAKVPLSIPIDALKTTLTPSPLADAVVLRDVMNGSNAWAVSGTKTADGRAILANDMHLGLSVPTIWYRYEMLIDDTRSAGVMLPGLPLLVAGSNGHLAWGSTNLSGDFLDLVSLEINPNNANEYKVGEHWQAFDTIKERILVKGEADQEFTVKQTQWGPVARNLLLNQAVAIHWTALDAETVNLGLLELEQAQNLEQAISLLNQAGSPQLNMLLADDKGQIAWTLTGKIPKRFGHDGSVSQSWAKADKGWQGYVDATELPKQINPADSFLVSANDRALLQDDSTSIGRQFADGYRAYRIKQRLNELTQVNEWSSFQLQLDTQTEFYQFYQQLALNSLSTQRLMQYPELTEIRSYLLAWDGHANLQSLGLPLIVKFRENLAKSVFMPYLAACKKADKDFNYSWTYIDTPLQALLTEQPLAVLPDNRYKDWNEFIFAQLKHSVEQLQNQYPDKHLFDLTWSEVNKIKLKHPFSESASFLAWLLDMPEASSAGCAGCVRTISDDFGASERMVVSPNHLADGILHMPVGQSAHPLSAYYRDQQAYWLQGLALKFLAGTAQHHLVFKANGS